MNDTDRLRAMVAEVEDGSTFSDVDLATIISDNDGDLNLAAAAIWRQKAASFSALVDMQEGNSRRDLSDLMKNALQMADTYSARADATDRISGRRGTTIGRISRA